MTVTPQLLRVALAAYFNVPLEAIAKLTVSEIDKNTMALRRVLDAVGDASELQQERAGL